MSIKKIAVILEAVYVPSKDIWELRDKITSKKIFEYDLGMIPLGFVIAIAVMNGVLSKVDYQRFLKEGLDEDTLLDVLTWFVDKFWKTRAMGKTLIEDLREMIEVYITLKPDKKEASISNINSADLLIEAIRRTSEKRKQHVEECLNLSA